MASFSSKTTTIKGISGENLCFEYLRAKGHTIYRPDKDDRAHPIDSFIVHGQKFTVCAADIKTKPKREAYPDTGIDLRHYGTYCYIKNVNNIPVFLFFVDEDEKRIYGNWLEILERRCEIQHNGKKLVYPLWMGGQIYFPISVMIHIADIPDDKVIELKKMRNTKFTGTFDSVQGFIDFEKKESA